MHKSYQPILPVSNRFLQKKWDDKYYSDHRSSVRKAQANIDTRPPKTYMHLHMKFKKIQLEEERTAVVERDNRILLDKMAHIMRTTGSVDSRNDYEPKSLNQEKRRRELLHISKENATMIKRIMERKLNTNGKDWKNSWTRHSIYLDNIAKYDSDWYLSKSVDHPVINEKFPSKRSQSVPKDEAADTKTFVKKHETQQTATENNESQQ